MQNGWIKLHRKLLNNIIFENEKGLKVWMWCLLRANHVENEVLIGRQKIIIKRGQFIMGSHKESMFLRMARSTFWFWLTWLQNEGQVELKKTNKYTIVTIPNWDKYQILDSNHTESCTQIVPNKKKKEEEKSLFLRKKREVEKISTSPLQEVSAEEDAVRPPPKPRKPRNHTAFLLQTRFIALCKEKLGIVPIRDGKGYFRLVSALKVLSKDQIRDLFDEWFSLGKPDEELVQITRALSNTQINGYKVRNHVQ